MSSSFTSKKNQLSLSEENHPRIKRFFSKDGGLEAGQKFYSVLHPPDTDGLIDTNFAESTEAFCLQNKVQDCTQALKLALVIQLKVDELVRLCSNTCSLGSELLSYRLIRNSVEYRRALGVSDPKTLIPEEPTKMPKKIEKKDKPRTKKPSQKKKKKD